MTPEENLMIRHGLEYAISCLKAKRQYLFLRYGEKPPNRERLASYDRDIKAFTGCIEALAKEINT